MIPVLTIVWGTEQNWSVKYISKNVVNILGYTAEEMLDENFRYASLMHPEDL